MNIIWYEHFMVLDNMSANLKEDFWWAGGYTDRHRDADLIISNVAIHQLVHSDRWRILSNSVEWSNGTLNGKS